MVWGVEEVRESENWRRMQGIRQNLRAVDSVAVRLFV